MVGIASAEMASMEEIDQASVSSEASTLWHTASSHNGTEDQESLAGAQKLKAGKSDSFADLYQFARKRIPSLSVVPTSKPISNGIANTIPSARSMSLPIGNVSGNGRTLEQPKPGRPNALSRENIGRLEAQATIRSHKEDIFGLFLNQEDALVDATNELNRLHFPVSEISPRQVSAESEADAQLKLKDEVIQDLLSRKAEDAKSSKQKIHGLETELELCHAELAELKAKLKRVSGEERKSKTLNNGMHGMQKKLEEKEALIAELDKNLKDEQGKCQFFMVQHQQTSLHRDELKAKYKEKSAEADKFRNEVERLQKIIERLHDPRKSLTGAAHFVRPAANEKLPRDVFACVECYARNTQCDAGNTCTTCHENNYKCIRLRCSLQHVLKRPCGPVCALRHSQNGWLIREQPRPEW